MNRGVVGAIIWAIMGLVIIGFGISAFIKSKRHVMNVNSQGKEMKDIKKYHFSLGILFSVYGASTVLLGIPMLAGQNSPFALISILGIIPLTISAAAVYLMIIESKYG